MSDVPMALTLIFLLQQLRSTGGKRIIYRVYRLLTDYGGPDYLPLTTCAPH